MESIKLHNYYFKYFNPLINTDMIRPLINGELEARQSSRGFIT